MNSIRQLPFGPGKSNLVSSNRAVLGWAIGLQALSFCLVSPALAQTAALPQLPPTSRDQIDRLKPVPIVPPTSDAASPRVQYQEVNPPCPFDGATAELTLNALNFQDVPPGYGKTLAKAFQDDLGKVINVSYLCVLRDRAAAELYNEGLIARVDIPTQTITGGRVNLLVTAAHVGSVVIDGEMRYRGLINDVAEDFTRLQPFDAIKADAIFRRMHLIVGGRDVVQSQLVPSTSGIRGDVVMRIRVLPSAPGLYQFTADNMGQKEYGQYSVGLSAQALRNRRLWGEFSGFVFSNYGDPDGKLTVAGVEYGVFRSKAADKIVLGYNQSSGVIGGSAAALELNVGLKQFTARYQRPLWLAETGQAGLTLGFEHNEQSTKLFETIDLIQENTASLYGSLQGQRRVAPFRRPGIATGNIEIRKGLILDDTTRKGDILSSDPQADPEAWVLSGQSGVTLALSATQRFDARFGFQYADTPLMGVDKITYGDRSFARGLSSGGLSGDRGYGLSFEFTQTITAPKFARHQAEAFAFWEHAGVETLGADQNTTSSFSAGIGARARYAGFNWQATVAKAFTDNGVDNDTRLSVTASHALPNAAQVAGGLRKGLDSFTGIPSALAKLRKPKAGG